LLQAPEFPSGYIVVSGEPGIGKTALLAQLVHQKGYVHHFNIAAQNIRDARSFLANTCAQLIIRYNLEHQSLPEEALKDSAILSGLLAEAAVKVNNQPIVILIDALDETWDIELALNANRLYLPSALPDGVFFVITTRPKAEYHLFVDRRKDLYLEDSDPRNLKDVRLYVHNFIATHAERMSPRIQEWSVPEAEFIDVLTAKSQGNFMYLVYVLHDIHAGRLSPSTLDSIRHLPQGLREYYQRHWRAMRQVDSDRFDRYYQPVVCILATVREPVTLAQVSEWTAMTPAQVKEVIEAWREFLNVDGAEQEDPLYRVYHTSFQDFLMDEVGLTPYHNIIAETALKKIRW
jgi:hypothetical protein